MKDCFWCGSQTPVDRDACMWCASLVCGCSPGFPCPDDDFDKDHDEKDQ